MDVFKIKLNNICFLFNCVLFYGKSSKSLLDITERKKYNRLWIKELDIF